MRVILRMRDLVRYGVNNWPTLARWIEKEGAPAGFYLGSNTRAWFKDEWDTWLTNRPKADPPGIKKPGPSGATEGTGRVTKAVEHSLNGESAAAAQASSNGGARWMPS